MNRIVNKFAFFLLTLTLMGSQLHAQFTTTFAKNVAPGQQNGLYYSLPQTVLKLDFIIQETELKKGPLSDYAYNYMEMSDYVEYDATEYKLLDVKINSIARPDPEAMFFVTFTPIRGAGKPEFDVLPNGIIRSVGVSKNPEAKETKEENPLEFKTIPPCCHEIPDHNLEFISLVSAGKTNSQIAKEVVDKISEIRKAKFYLISGDVEMATNPETFNAMYQKLDEMETEYQSLLLGKRSVKTVVKSIYLVPKEEDTLQTIAKFSEAEGLTMGPKGSGSPISVHVVSQNTISTINAPSRSAVESMSYENKVFYRIPEVANVKVALGKELLIEDRLTINQLGVFLTAPLTNNKLVFDIETGQIVNMKMQ